MSDCTCANRDGDLNARLDALRGQYEDLRDGKAHRESGGPQRRGFAFEGLLFDILDANDLQPRRSYRPRGEQVDASFIHCGRVYLLEAKWVKPPIAASELYAFKGKVDGKLTGTLGIFISMSGYAEDAVDALIAGKALNLILFDRDDFELSLDFGVGFVEVLTRKLRFAADEGSPYYPARNEQELKPTVLVTEGLLDLTLLRAIVRKVAPDNYSFVEFVSAGGALNTINIAKHVLDRNRHARVVVVVDDDGAGQQAKQSATAELGDRIKMITSQPYLDVILKDRIDATYGSYERYRMEPYQRRQAYVDSEILLVPTETLITDPTVRAILAAIGAEVHRR